MLTRSEKTYFALTLVFLASGFGLKAWRRATVRLGPFPDAETLVQDSIRAIDSSRAAGPSASADSGGAPATDPRPAGEGLMASDSSAAPIASAGPVEAAAAPLRSSAGTSGRRASRKPSSEGSGFTGKIDLNRADAAGLMRIKGVGEKTAEAILAYRRAHGPFRDMRDLLQIKGIGEKKLEKLAPHIIL